MKSTDSTVAFALRLFGGIDLLALAAAAMPLAWMQSLNERLGFGTMPALPVVEYLARQTSLWYAVHAGTLLFLASDVPRFRPVIRFIAWAGLAFVACLTAVNVTSGLPAWWTTAQLFGGGFENVALLVLLRHAANHSGSEGGRIESASEGE